MRGRGAPQKEDLRLQAIEMGLLPRHARGQGQREGSKQIHLIRHKVLMMIIRWDSHGQGQPSSQVNLPVLVH